MDRKIENLLLTKEYEKLTPKEREFVNTQMSVSEYRNRRLLLINTKKAFSLEIERLEEPRISSSGIKKALQTKRTNYKLSNSILYKLRLNFTSNKLAYTFILATITIVSLYILISPDTSSETPDIATIYLYEGRELHSINSSADRTDDIEVTNGYLLNNDSLYKELDKMNDYLIIKTEGLNEDVIIPYQE